MSTSCADLRVLPKKPPWTEGISKSRLRFCKKRTLPLSYQSNAGVSFYPDPLRYPAPDIFPDSSSIADELIHVKRLCGCLGLSMSGHRPHTGLRNHISSNILVIIRSCRVPTLTLLLLRHFVQIPKRIIFSALSSRGGGGGFRIPP